MELDQTAKTRYNMEVRRLIDAGFEFRAATIHLREDEAPGEESGGSSTSSASEARQIFGYAAVFNSESEDLGFIEIIEPGAFSEAIAKSDVRALKNHDPNLIMARTANQSLTLREDNVGLYYEFSAPSTTTGNDLLYEVRNGLITQSSFAFRVEEDVWESKELPTGRMQWTRRIKKIMELYDVSPVTYPAYIHTSASSRAAIPSTPTAKQQKSLRMRFLEVLARNI